ncbi:hypothetical protein FQN53_005542 [Emmonsiellopsis sp. PD_33]|nr:hypothetical protein FQN53_005542 [Emmonsiellopsis sp. PD_33]
MPEGYFPVDDDDDDDLHIHRHPAKNSLHALSDDEDADIVDGLDDDEGPLVRRDSILFNRDYHGLGLDAAAQGADHSHEHGGTELGGWASMWLAYQSIGAIYGDIGTSPLYVFSSTFPAPPVLDDLIGVLSLIIWALILIATIKYVGIVLCANDKGEGGSFALFSLIRRYIDIDNINAGVSDFGLLKDGERKELKPFNAAFFDKLKRSSRAKRVVKILAVLGVYGVLTPAQSILGAVQGIKIAAPDTATNTVVAIACVLIVFLFVLQPFGTSKLSNFFAPIVIVWLLFNVTSGVFNLFAHDSSVLRAFSPWFGIHYLIRRKFEGWKSLGGVLLCFTGVEALFADLGAFSVKAIRVSWLCFAFPCLIITYCGQAAFISDHPEAILNPLFKSAPKGMYWPIFLLSILTSIVASQAMLTGTFQLMSQAIRMGYLPKIRAVHTSKRISSQIYIPWANWLMMLAALLTTAVFKTTSKLGNAYGVCVVGVGFITCWLVALVALIIWNLHFIIVIPIFLFFAFIDGLFLSSAFYKVPSGGWFTIAMAATLASTLLTWNYGEECQKEADRDDSSPSRSTVFAGPDGALFIRQGNVDRGVKIIRGIGVFLVETDSRSPPVYDHFLRKFEASHEITVLLHIKHIPKHHIPPENRFRVSAIGIRGVFRVSLQLGYGDHIFWDTFEPSLLHELGSVISTTNNPTTPHIKDSEAEAEADSPTATSPSPLLFPSSSTDILLSTLPSTNSTTVSNQPPPSPLSEASLTSKPITYIVGRDRLYLKAESNFVRRALLAVFVYVKNHQRSGLAGMRVPVDRLVEVGFSKAV